MTSVPAVERQRHRRDEARRLSRAALGTALILLFIAGVRFLPTGDAFLYGMAGLSLALVVSLCGPLYGFLAYLGSGILSFAFFGPLTALPFIVWYGLWVGVKFGLEYLGARCGWKIPVVWGLKAAVGILIGIAACFFVGQLLAPSVLLYLEEYPILLYLLPLGLTAILLLYDYLLGCLLDEACQRWPELFR